MFTYTAADGTTTLHGLDSVSVELRSGEEVPGARQRLRRPGVGQQHRARDFVDAERARPSTASSSSTSTRAPCPGMGKRTLDAIYLKLGQAEIDDMAEGVKALWGRPYFDKTRVGIYGTSYGGYAAVMELLRHPDVFAAASASSPVDRLAQLRHDLHRALHVDAAGEQGGLRRRQRDDVREGPEGPAAALLRHRRQQRPPVEHRCS